MTRQDDFKRRHPDWTHRDVPFGSEQGERLSAAWRLMLDSQNGRDVDDILPGGMTHFLRMNGLNEGQGKRLLILGCGTGEELVEARALGWVVDGITLGPMNVVVAKEQGIEVAFEDLHFSSFATGHCDAIVGRQVWEHSWAPFLFAIECARLLKPGGKLALETPNAANYTYESATIHHVFCPTPFQGRKLLEKAGFIDVLALDGSAGPPVPFSDEDFGHEHRDDVGGGNIVFTGTRWSVKDSERVNALVRQMTDAGGDSRELSIEAMYREILERPADRAGVAHYATSRLTLDEIRAALKNSPEAHAIRQHRTGP